MPDVRTSIHLHGGRSRPIDDGWPLEWFTNDPNAPANGLGGPPGNFKIYEYPNNQRPSTLWYHDHSLGITRLAAYAGMAAFYLILGPTDMPAGSPGSLNLPQGPYHIGIAIQDRQFDVDPASPTFGQLVYPAMWMPEYFPDPATGGAMIVNGVTWPYYEVEPRKYRIRILNGCNDRFLDLSFTNGMSFTIIGTEGGLLGKPATVTHVLMGPAERVDLLIDFAGHNGEVFEMTNAALAPYPNGGDASLPDVMQFRVTLPLQGTDTYAIPARLPPIQRLLPVNAVKTRDIVLSEVAYPMDPTLPMPLLNRTPFHMPATETPKLGTTEIWRFINITGDMHPMHTHLVLGQILDRIPFDAVTFDTDWNAWVDAGRDPATEPKVDNYILGPGVPPGPDENAWKETYRCPPAFITRIIAKFDGYTGRYVYHCHILAHEENEMMRPMEVIP